MLSPVRSQLLFAVWRKHISGGMGDSARQWGGFSHLHLQSSHATSAHTLTLTLTHPPIHHYTQPLLKSYLHAEPSLRRIKASRTYPLLSAHPAPPPRKKNKFHTSRLATDVPVVMTCMWRCKRCDVSQVRKRSSPHRLTICTRPVAGPGCSSAERRGGDWMRGGRVRWRWMWRSCDPCRRRRVRGGDLRVWRGGNGGLLNADGTRRCRILDSRATTQ